MSVSGGRINIWKIVPEVTNLPGVKKTSQVLENLGVKKEQGLAEAEADQRKQKFGPNKLRETERKSRWKILLDQFKSFLVVLLGVAAVVSLLVGQRLVGISILAVLDVVQH